MLLMTWRNALALWRAGTTTTTWEYGYCPHLGTAALAMPSCVCGHCVDETRPPGQQNKCPTQPGAPLAKLMRDRQRGVPLPLDLKHIRWGVFHEKPFEPEPLIPTPTRLFPRVASTDPLSIYPPEGSSHEHTFKKEIPEHVLHALALSTFFGHKVRHWRRNDPIGITRKYVKALLGHQLTPALRKKALFHRKEMIKGEHKYYYKARHEAAMNIQCIARGVIARCPRSV
jgi:hypothetical protein